MHVAELKLYHGYMGSQGIDFLPFRRPDELLHLSEPERELRERATQYVATELEQSPARVLVGGIFRYGHEALITEQGSITLQESLSHAFPHLTRGIAIDHADGGDVMFYRLLVIPDVRDNDTMIGNLTQHLDRMNISVYPDAQLHHASQPILRGGCGITLEVQAPYIPSPVVGREREKLLRKRLTVHEV